MMRSSATQEDGRLPNVAMQNINCIGSASMDKMRDIKQASRFHLWHWDENNKSDECQLSEDRLDVCFHPDCSQSAAAIRGTTPFKRDGNYYYWEVTVLNKVYGTSVMFGLCTKDQRLDLYDYKNLIGLDENGWSLSHKGSIWHNNKTRQYTQMFQSDRSVTIGMFYDTSRGTLSYFKDGENLGVAFHGLNEVEADLYPVVGSTAKCTRMRLEGSYCGFTSLKERASFNLMKRTPDRLALIDQMMNDYHLPKNLVFYLAETALICSSQAAITQQRSLPKERRSLVINNPMTFDGSGPGSSDEKTTNQQDRNIIQKHSRQQQQQLQQQQLQQDHQTLNRFATIY